MLGKFVYSVTMETNSIKSLSVLLLMYSLDGLDICVYKGETATKLGKQLLKCFVTSVAYTLFPLLKFEMLPAFQIPQFSIKLLVIMDFTQDKHCK